MANAKISELPQIITINNSIEFPINDAGTTKKVSWGGLLGNITAGGYSTKIANYQILDDDGIEYLYGNATNGNITFGLPTAADNAGRRILIKKIGGTGRVIITGEGAETIDGESSISLILLYDYLDITCDGNGWYVNKLTQKIKSGFVNRNDWTTVIIGSINLDYDNKVGTWVVGERITGANTGDTGIIESDDGSTLILREVTSGGIFQNNEVITGSVSGTTADVNEPTGSAKNLDSNFYHGLGQNLDEYNIKFLISTDGTYNNSFVFFPNAQETDAGADDGSQIEQVDTNNCLIRTGSSSAGAFVEVGGNTTRLDAEDYYYNIILERIK